MEIRLSEEIFKIAPSTSQWKMICTRELHDFKSWGQLQMLLRRRNTVQSPVSSLSHLNKIRSLWYLAVPYVGPVDGKKSIVRLDPPVQSRDGVLQDLHYEDARLWTAATDPDAEMFPRLSLQADGQHVLVVPEGAGPAGPGPSPPVLLYPLPVHSQPQHARHLPQGSAHLEWETFQTFIHYLLSI